MYHNRQLYTYTQICKLKEINFLWSRLRLSLKKGEKNHEDKSTMQTNGERFMAQETKNFESGKASAVHQVTIQEKQ